MAATSTINNHKRTRRTKSKKRQNNNYDLEYLIEQSKSSKYRDAMRAKIFLHHR